MTEFKVGNKTFYLSALLDLFNREIVSYTISDKITLASTLEMLEKAFVNLPKKNELIIHSDRCWQYQMEEYQSCLAKRGIVQSMYRKGNCLDNAVIEIFFGLLKTEFYYREKFENSKEFESELLGYLHYYNNDRIKIKLDGMSPVQYRVQFERTT